MRKLVFTLNLLMIVATTFSQYPCYPKLRRVTLNTNSGYVNINELTTGYGLVGVNVPYSKHFYGLTTMHGYQLNMYGLRVNNTLQGGLATGMLFFESGALFPLYGDIRFIINRRIISPFVFANSGLLINAQDFGDSMLFINGGGGVILKLTDKLAINIGPGLLLHMGPDSGRSSLLNLKLGVILKPI